MRVNLRCGKRLCLEAIKTLPKDRPYLTMTLQDISEDPDVKRFCLAQLLNTAQETWK